MEHQRRDPQEIERLRKGPLTGQQIARRDLGLKLAKQEQFYQSLQGTYFNISRPHQRWLDRKGARR